jgi:hypothetical protein
MASKNSVDELIREALTAEDADDLEQLGEPGLPDMVTDVFRGRLRWYGAMFLTMILVFAVLAVYCAVRFLGTADVPEMLRWGAGFFLCVLVTMGGKNWYWMQMERLAMTREIKRVELLIAHLATELRPRT